MSSGRDETHGVCQSTFVTQLQQNDVLIGRGAPITDNIGNQRYLNLVREKCIGYQKAASRKEKDAIARQIVNTIHARNGLFLRKIDSPEEAMFLGVPQDVTAWTAADEKTVLLKIKQALRDRGLEERDHQVPSPPRDQAEATEVQSQFNDEELGADDMVAAGLTASSHVAPQLEPQHRVKRAKTQSLQDSTSRESFSQAQAPAPGLTMSAPAEVPAAGINRFQGVPDSRLNLQLPLRANFSQATGTLGGYYSQLPIPSQRIGQDWHVDKAVAGINLSRAISIDLPPARTAANVGSEEGKQLLADLIRRAHSVSSLVQAVNLQHQANEGEMKFEEKPTTSQAALEKETSGEIALRIACEACEMGRDTFNGGAVKLDPIELCLLIVLSSRGLPTWSSTCFQNGDIVSAQAARSSDSITAGSLSWTDVGNRLVQEVQIFLSRKTSKLFPNDPPTMRGSAIDGFVSRLVSMAIAYSKNPTSLARMAIMLLEKIKRHSQFAPILSFAAAAAGATTTASMSAPPPPLSRTFSDASIGASLPLSRTFSAASCGAPTSFRRAGSWISDSESSSYHGARGGFFFARDAVLQRATAMGAARMDSQTTGGAGGGEFLFDGFLTSELRCWATSLNVVDEVGLPVPFSSQEFAGGLGLGNSNILSQYLYGQQGQDDVLATAAVLDGIGCKAILHQISFLTRLRSLFLTNSSDHLLATLRTVSMQAPATAAANNRWRGINFVDPAILDMTLIKALLANGFSGLMMMTNTNNSNNTDGDLLSTLLRHSSMTKADVEKQALQLTCQLHRHFQSKKINQVVSQQAAKLVELMASR